MKNGKLGWLSAAAALLVACGGGAQGNVAEASVDAAGVELALGSVTATPLGTSTADEVYALALETLDEDLLAARAAQPSVARVKVSDAYRFARPSWNLYNALRQYAEDRGLTDIVLDDFEAEYPTWLRAKVDGTADDQGLVRNDVVDSELPWVFWRALEETNTRNALARAKNPAGLSVRTLRETWFQVNPSTHGATFHLPVQLNGLPSAQDVASLFGLHPCEVPLVATAAGAVTEFGKNYESDLAKAREYDRFAQLLRKPSIRRRYYFAGGSERQCTQYYGWWSRDLLVVVDEHHQMYAFERAYSE